MSRTCIVTDSGARFASPHFVQQNAVTVVPNRINIGGKLYREGVDLKTDEALRLIASLDTAPQLVPPSVAEYVEVYRRLSRSHDAIISVHMSGQLSESWRNAKTAAEQFAGHCDIAVIDSRSLCVGQGLLVQVAARTIQSVPLFDDVVSAVRGAVERVYAVYYTESLHYLMQRQIMSESHVALGSLLGIKPFLALEDGSLIVIEKVRTRGQAVERLVEFLVEFTDLEEAVIVQHKAHISEPTRMLQDRLSVEFPGRYFPYTTYGASMAAFIGVDATGIVVLEQEASGFDDDF